ncbi:hypothetical protein A45J_0091 [hot springs metagenome]|uniref:Flagellar assembly protein T N-terminal domain-containing protein n=1 Tax=hot springs metagenome TaxID=433727 RepID=A0A5J4L4G1_9ZZZZ
MYCKNVVLIFLFICVFFASEGLCEVKCIDAEGEAIIINNDTPSAKAEAIARAKWAAVEQVVGVEVKAQSIVQNMALIDDAVSKNIRGFVARYKLLQQENRKDTMWVKINACVEPVKAREAISSLALNNSIAVFIPARKPKVVKEFEEKYKTPYSKTQRSGLERKDEYDETNILSETLIGRLTEYGYTIVDVAPTDAVDAREIESAIKSGNFMTMRSLMYKFLSNILIIGSIDYTISTRKGQDIGYGISMPFNNVTVRLTYRIVTRDASGKTNILAADTADGKGMSLNVEDAVANGMKDLAAKLIPVVIDKVGQHVKGIAKKIQIKVTGVNDINTNFEIKDILQNIAWVSNVEDKGIGEFIVSYPENTVYLANSISQKGFQVVSFSPYSITVKYQK